MSMYGDPFTVTSSESIASREQINKREANKIRLTVVKSREPQEVRELVADERVTWMHRRAIGSSVTFTTRTGKVISQDGSIVAVRYRGKTLRVNRKTLTPENEQSQLDKLVMCGSMFGKVGA